MSDASDSVPTSASPVSGDDEAVTATVTAERDPSVSDPAQDAAEERSAEASFARAVRIPYGVRLASAWAGRLLLVAAALGVVCYLVVELRDVVIPVLVAILLAALLVPFKEFLRRSGWPKWLAVLVAFLSFLVVVAALATLGVTQFARASHQLTKATERSWVSFRDWLQNGPFQISQHQIDGWLTNVYDVVQNSSDRIFNGALSVGTGVGHFIAGLLIALFAVLFFLIEGELIWRWVLRIFPKRSRVILDGSGRAAWRTLQHFVRVQIVVAAINAVGIGLGAFILGLPLAVPIGVLVFLGSFVPVVGAVVTGAIAVFVGLVFAGPVVGLVMLGIVLLVQQAEGHLLHPLLTGNVVKIHPLAVILAVATGTVLAGVPGAFFAVPVAAAANAMITYVARKART